ncbi:glutathione S-transferase N-terminal domain-containing protein [Phenylobacterium sp.]|uniref:glutathione S-transferase N-terminal domain-containing protein n=1 Tax=Phenylobacterium sp. TaxID=1871053 RepID=UPI0025F9AA60|nr:glutathione S-transferase N-terminal domain-containing protein [Phenylobacterium sp.]
MLRLHHAPLACSLASRLALMEAGLEHEIVFVHTTRGEQRGEAYRAINPRGQVPALETPEGVLTESSAILPYIADLAPDRRLMPSPGTFARAEAQAWLGHLATSIHGAYGGLLKPEFACAREAYVAQLAAALHALDARLAGQDTMLGAFSVVDLYLLVFCLWRATVPGLPALPHLDAFQQRMLARPGIAPTIGEEMRLRAETA